MGIGVGLAFLIANSKNEFDKLKELQKQIEMLLRDIKNEMQRKDMISSGTKLINNNLAIRNSGSSDCLVMALSTMESGQCSKSDLTKERAKSVGINQLEAELVAELERLQLKLDDEDTFELPVQQCMEVCIIIYFSFFTFLCVCCLFFLFFSFG